MDIKRVIVQTMLDSSCREVMKKLKGGKNG